VKEKRSLVEAAKKTGKVLLARKGTHRRKKKASSPPEKAGLPKKGGTLGGKETKPALRGRTDEAMSWKTSRRTA